MSTVDADWFKLWLVFLLAAVLGGGVLVGVVAACVLLKLLG